ncbi:MAG: hypothetical protein EZS28_031793, partial [Streblomastix strix]
QIPTPCNSRHITCQNPNGYPLKCKNKHFLLLSVIIYYATRSFFDASANIVEIYNQIFDQPGDGLGQIDFDESDDICIITNCTFANINKTSGNGGCMELYIRNRGKASINNCSFTYCDVLDEGGAIYASISTGGKLTIDGMCSFSGCFSYNANGGGIYVEIDGETSKFILEDWIIFYNCSAEVGGALFIQSSNAAVVTLGQSLFLDCLSGFDGGAIYINLYGGTSYIQIEGDITFRNCSSIQGYGGGMYMNVQNDFEITTSHTVLFDNCSSVTAQLFLVTDYIGIVIRITGDIQFKQCYSSIAGGGIHTESVDGSLIETSNFSFDGCSSEQNAGGAFIQSSDRSENIIRGLTIQNCETSGDGGGILLYIVNQYSILQVIDLTVTNCSSWSYGGGISINIHDKAVVQFEGYCHVTKCTSQNIAGGIFVYIWNIYEVVDINADLIIDSCTSILDGGGMYVNLYRGGEIIIRNKSKITNCKSEGGNGGGIYIQIDFQYSYQFIINDALIQECEAKADQTHLFQTGYGGGMFLTGSGDYDPSTLRLDLKGMRILGNTANNGGQSLYVAITKLAEWCRTGTAGEYVKGNYIDSTSDLNELQGVRMDYSTFKILLISQIQNQQRSLEYYWNVRNQIYHIQNRNGGQYYGQDQYWCGNIDEPCESIEYALKQISVRNGGNETTPISEKKIGITEGGLQLSNPFSFSESSSYTSVIKIMKQMYGTTSAMTEQAEIKIIKGSSGSTVESGHKGWISAAQGLQLRIYGIKIITDQYKLTIPIINIQDTDSILELDTVTFSGIQLSPATEAKGIVHINVDNSQFIAQSCIFQNMDIDSQGGNAIRIVNEGSSSITGTIKGCQFNNIKSIGDSNGQGGSAIFMENKHGSKLIIDDNCEFYKCNIDKGNGGAIYIDIDFTSEFEFKIKDALIQDCEEKADPTKRYPTGYGGGIFLTGSGDYDPSTLRLDLKGMRILGNTANNGGQSLYVAITKLAE